ncbi:MAG TPA: STAS domain-containing protein [Candidatus Eisenbacteria bacterium]|nr:STAS domain-containing protein [Candidatus Eisenbacteria bacterium]
MAQGSNGQSVYSDKQLVISRADSPPGLSITGAIDYYNAEAVAEALTALFHADGDARAILADAITGNGDLHLDLTRLEFTDVTGIRALVRIAENAGDGKRLVLRGLPPSIVKVMTVVGWSELPNLVIEPSE